jgi:hypothetical protein
MAVETELHEKITIEGAEEGESKLRRLSGAVEKVAGAFEGLAEVAGALGGIAGVWKFAEGIEEANALYGSIDRITKITGVAAEKAHGIFDAFEKAGVGAESTEAVLTSMARMAGKIGGSVSVTADEAERMDALMRRLGVNIKAGPVDQILQMSEAAQRGRLGLQDLTTVFGVQRGQAEKMMLLLQGGPEKIRQTMEETAKGAGVIDEAALRSFEEMGKARLELKNAWNDIVLVLYKSVIPAVTTVLETIKSLFESIKPIANSIGQALAGHMQTVVALTKTWLGLMAANKVANMFAGEGGGKKLLGEEGRFAQIYGAAQKFLGGNKFAKAGGADYFEAKSAFKGIGMFENAGGLLSRIVGSVAGRLGIIGAVIAIVITAFEMLKNNVWGLRTMLAGTLSRIFSTLKQVGEKVISVLGKLWDAIKPIVMLIAGGLLLQLEFLATMIEALAWVVDKVMDAMIGIVNGVIWLLNKIPGVDIDMIDIDKAKDRAGSDAEGKKTGDGKGQNVYQDFRGSKFEITNQFDKGVDGGRVSVAIGDELARLGERRLDSGLRPLYSYR